MAITLTATPLPESAAVRLRLDAVAGYTTTLWDYSTGGQAYNNAQAGSWETTGAITVTGGPTYLKVTTNAADGTKYITYHLSQLEVGQRYSVSVWVTYAPYGPVTIGRGGTAQRTTQSINSAEPAGGMGSTFQTYEFVAAATTEDVRITALSTSGGFAEFRIGALSVRNIPNQRLAYIQDLSANDSANWAVVSGAPTNGAQSVSTTTMTSGGTTQYGVGGLFRSNSSGTSAVYAPNVAGIKRTISGLTVGRRYRINVSGSASLVTSSAVTGGTTTQALAWAPGVAGIGRGSSVTSGWGTFEFVATATSHVVEMVATSSFTAWGGTTAGSSAYGQMVERALYVEDLFASVTNQYVLASLVRSDANGTNPVRLYEDQGLSDGVLIHTDAEPATTGLIAYTATLLDVGTSATQTVSASTTLDGLVTETRIAPAVLPARGVWVRLITQYGATRETTTTVAQVINRPDPLVTLGVQATRTGSLSILCESYPVALGVAAAYNAGEVMLLRQPDHAGLDMYHVGTRVQIDPDIETGRWIVTLDYVEVAVPTAPLRGSIGWTFGASLALDPTFAASRVRFPTFVDLTVGPQ